MVCSKCQKSLKRTELATPGVKRKNDMAWDSSKANGKSGPSATLGNTGVGKVSCAACRGDPGARLMIRDVIE